MACYYGETWKFDSIVTGQMPKIVEFLSDKSFLFGEQIKWPDFVFYEFINLLEFVTKKKCF